MNEIIKEFHKRNSQYTEKQLKDVISGIIDSGDLVLKTTMPSGITSVSYAPYREMQKLQAKLATIQEKLQARQSDCMGRFDWNKGVDGMLVGELLAILKGVDDE